MSADLARQFAPTGAFRVAINYGNAVLAQRDPAGGDEPRGVSADLARELARRLGLEPTFIGFDAAGRVADAVARGEIDVLFLAIDPVRAADIDFTGPYVLIEGGYAVRDDSPLRAIEEVDRPGVHIAAAKGSAYDLHLARTLKHAERVLAATGEDAIRRYLDERLDALAGVKTALHRFVAAHPGHRVMDGRFMAIEQAMGIAKGRAEACAYLTRFVEEMKACGFVAEALKRSGQGAVQVA